MSVTEFLKEEKILMEESLQGYIKEHKREAFGLLGNSGITILYGLRGIGKTTLMAQKYFGVENRLAIHGEHLHLAGYGVKDLISPLRHVITEGFLFVDEITKLKGWAQELKVLSDMYPKLKIIASGSSAVDLQDARRTLARRANFINLKPLSFSEFLSIRYETDIASFDPFSEDPLTQALKVDLDARTKLKNIADLTGEFRFMNMPYLMEKPASTLLDMVDRVIFEDIGAVASFTEDVMEKYWPLIKLLALSEKTSYDALAKDLGIGKGTIIRMMDYLAKANLVRPIYPYAKGKGKVRKEAKYLFTSPAVRAIVLDLLGEKDRAVGLAREDMFAMHIDELLYLKSGPDYVWKKMLFEIGGPSKGTDQLKDFPFKGRKYLVYDGLEVSGGTVFKIPLYIFLTHFKGV